MQMVVLAGANLVRRRIARRQCLCRLRAASRLRFLQKWHRHWAAERGFSRVEIEQMTRTQGNLARGFYMDADSRSSTRNVMPAFCRR